MKNLYVHDSFILDLYVQQGLYVAVLVYVVQCYISSQYMRYVWITDMGVLMDDNTDINIKQISIFTEIIKTPFVHFQLTKLTVRLNVTVMKYYGNNNKNAYVKAAL